MLGGRGKGEVGVLVCEGGGRLAGVSVSVSRSDG